MAQNQRTVDFFNDYLHCIGKIQQWILRTLKESCSHKKSLSELNFQVMEGFFNPKTLKNSFVIYSDKIPLIPLEELGLSQFGELNERDFKAITYCDCFFVKPEQRNNINLHLHELIHVVQWGYLGMEKFLFCYAQGLANNGYFNSPLEEMAFRLERRFRDGEVFNIEEAIVNEMIYFDELIANSGLFQK